MSMNKTMKATRPCTYHKSIEPFQIRSVLYALAVFRVTSQIDVDEHGYRRTKSCTKETIIVASSADITAALVLEILALSYVASNMTS